MKATIEFSLPEDGYQYERASMAMAMTVFIDEFSEYLRNLDRGKVSNTWENPEDAIAGIRMNWFALAEEFNVKFGEE
jgi:hypothetical protein